LKTQNKIKKTEKIIQKSRQSKINEKKQQKAVKLKIYLKKIPATSTKRRWSASVDASQRNNAAMEEEEEESDVTPAAAVCSRASSSKGRTATSSQVFFFPFFSKKFSKTYISAYNIFFFKRRKGNCKEEAEQEGRQLER
jgi:hypothetical protein